MYDGFFKDDSSLLGKQYPTIVVVKNGYFFVEGSEVEKSDISIKDCVLFKNRVYIIWNWFWGDEVFEDTPSTPFDQNEEESSVLSSESVHEDDQEETAHAVMFKCVGVIKGESGLKIQKVLEEIARKLRNGDTVSVRVTTEPENPFDPNAVVFQTPVNGKWMNIGYVVREAAPHVGYAIANNLIVQV